MLSNRMEKAERTSTDFNAESSPSIISALIWFQKLLDHNWEKSKAYNLGDKRNIKKKK